MMILKDFPILQVLSPFISALVIVFTQRFIILARIIAIIGVFLSFIISITQLNKVFTKPILYFFGNWQAPIGIEYNIDYLNQPIIVYINFVLLFFLLFCHKITQKDILSAIPLKRQSLFYSVLLFTHTGFLGMVSTNDIFNLYVFIEISALGSYVLMAQGHDKRALIGAFDYLIFGSIGATFILIGIGFLLSLTGSLNMTDIAARLTNLQNSQVLIAAISFILIGVLLKTAFFPMYFWMIRAYRGAAPILLIYLAGISTIIGIYVFFRFIHFVLNYDQIITELSVFIRILALSTIILCAYYAYKAKNLIDIIIYSTASQIGYAFLLLVNKDIPYSFLFTFLLADSLNKIALFLIIAYQNYNNFSNKISWRILVGLSLICSSGLPISAMFIIKLSIFELFLKQNLWLDFIIVLLSSTFGLLYHYKIAKILFWPKFIEKKLPFIYKLKFYNLAFILLLQFLLFISLNKLSAI